MEDIFKTLPQHTCSWSKGRLIMYHHQGFWNSREFHEGGLMAQKSFNPRPSDVLLCSYPKSGTTWLKALAFAIITREKFNASNSPLLTTFPHECVPFLEKEINQIQDNPNNPLVATHLPYASLPESVLNSNCKIVYMYRNIKDVIVSHFEYLRELVKLPMEDAPFEEAFDEFSRGISFYGPYWNHILGYWKANRERPETVLLLKYEDMRKDPMSNVKMVAEFMGYPFSIEEIKARVVENIINLCSFENLSNLEVNKSGMHYLVDANSAIENKIFFRKAKDGDWKNYFTDEMKEKIDKLVDQKLSDTGLTLK